MRDIRFRNFFSVQTKEDFVNHLFSTAPATYVENLPLNNNEWTYLNTLKGVQIKKDNTPTVEAWISVKLGTLEVGDVIKTSVELFNISGTKAKISIASGGAEDEVSSIKSNEWETLNLKYVVRRGGEHIIYIGVWRNDPATEFIMRNIKCETLSQAKKEVSIVERRSNPHGTYTKWDDGQMECVGNITKTGKVDKSWENLYYIDMGSVPYPHPFKDIPDIVFGNCGNRLGFIGSYFDSSVSDDFRKENTPRVELYRPMADTGGHLYKLSYIAKGRWR